MRLVVTRPRAQADALVAELQARAVDAVALPLIDIRAPADPQPLQQAWQGLQSLHLLMFVSANAVQHFMRLRPPGQRWPAGLLAASTGPGTSLALRAAGVSEPALVEPLGEVFDSEALWERLRTRDWKGRRVLVVRGEGGRDWLAEQLGQAGAEVGFVAAYQRVLPQLDPSAQALLDAAREQPAQHLWQFSSSQAVDHLAQLAPGGDWAGSSALAPHPRIVAALQRLGFGQVRRAAVDAQALAAALAAVSGAGRSIQSPAQ
jgi:uroporphyrinogen-III synthase